jgi:hypothetical protein
MIRSVLVLVLILVGCNKKTAELESESTGASSANGGGFLDEPAGLPPSVLAPAFIEVHLRAATDLAAARAGLLALSGVASVSTEAPTEDVAALVAQKVPAPVLRARYDSPDAVRQQQLLKLVDSGVRGNLVLWYPLMQIRERLNDGVTGVWRGITRMREELPTDGARLGGTPVLLMAAVTALDVALLEGGAPAGYSAIVQGKGDLFRGPDGTHMAWLVPRGRAIVDSSFDTAVESLVPLVKQGGKAWLLIGLPLAEERKPERL